MRRRSGAAAVAGDIHRGAAVASAAQNLVSALHGVEVDRVQQRFEIAQKGSCDLFGTVLDLLHDDSPFDGSSAAARRPARETAETIKPRRRRCVRGGENRARWRSVIR